MSVSSPPHPSVRRNSNLHHLCGEGNSRLQLAAVSPALKKWSNFFSAGRQQKVKKRASYIFSVHFSRAELVFRAFSSFFPPLLRFEKRGPSEEVKARRKEEEEEEIDSLSFGAANFCAEKRRGGVKNVGAYKRVMHCSSAPVGSGK